MVLSKALFGTKGKVEILKMWRVPSGIPIFQILPWRSEPVCRMEVNFVALINA
ncbi:MAG: hypothetical protein JWN56_963 [Sphingobacteriales bacterium]|nr:hypothetical protein [Sphingobacteriales bacterium]